MGTDRFAVHHGTVTANVDPRPHKAIQKVPTRSCATVVGLSRRVATPPSVPTVPSCPSTKIPPNLKKQNIRYCQHGGQEEFAQFIL